MGIDGRGKFLPFVVTATLIRFLTKASGSIYILALSALTLDFAFDTETAKMLIPTYLVGGFVSQFLVGPLSDHYGRRRLLTGMMLMFSMSALLIPFASQSEILFLLMFSMGMGGASMPPLANAAIADSVNRQTKLAKTLAWTSMAVILAPAIAIAAGGYITNAFGWRAVFWFISGSSIGLFLLVRRYFPETKAASEKKMTVKSMFGAYAETLRQSHFMLLALGLAFLGGGMAAYYASGIFYLSHTLSLGPSQIATLTLILITGNILGRVLMTKFIDKTGNELWIMMGATATVVATMLIAILSQFFVQSALVLVIPMGLFVLALGSIMPVCRSTLMKWNPKGFGTSESATGLIMAAIGAIVSYFAAKHDVATLTHFSHLMLFLSVSGTVLIGLGLKQASDHRVTFGKSTVSANS